MIHLKTLFLQIRINWDNIQLKVWWCILRFKKMRLHCIKSTPKLFKCIFRRSFLLPPKQFGRIVYGSGMVCLSAGPRTDESTLHRSKWQLSGPQLQGRSTESNYSSPIRKELRTVFCLTGAMSTDVTTPLPSWCRWVVKIWAGTGVIVPLLKMSTS